MMPEAEQSSLSVPLTSSAHAGANEQSGERKRQ